MAPIGQTYVQFPQATHLSGLIRISHASLQPIFNSATAERFGSIRVASNAAVPHKTLATTNGTVHPNSVAKYAVMPADTAPPRFPSEFITPVTDPLKSPAISRHSAQDT